MKIKKGDWVKASRKVYIGCNRKDFFCIVKIESLVDYSRIRAKYFIKNGYGRYISNYIQLGIEYPSFSAKRKAYSNEIFSSITDFKVSQ